MTKRKRTSIEDHAMGRGGDHLAAEIKDLIVNAERPDLMFFFLNLAVTGFANIVVAKGDPDIVAQWTKCFIDGDGNGYTACARYIALKREADFEAEDAEDDGP
jgi:hypothetical protein